MLDLIEETILTIHGREAKIHAAREFLQLLILKLVYDKRHFKNLAFVGGTALRFLYDLRRFSEDLDFSVIDRKGFKFPIFLDRMVSELENTGFSLDVKKGREGTVQSAMLRFKQILYTLGLSPIKTQKLSIKLEVDTNPPKGWNTQISPVSRHFVFAVTHFDIPSLYATKLHACFFRKYTKGRDFYDLLWYLGKKVQPNFRLLNNAIKQTEHRQGNVNEENFKVFLRDKLADVDFAEVRKDVRRFIEDKNELKMLDRDLILKLI